MLMLLACSQSTVADAVHGIVDGRCKCSSCGAGDVDSKAVLAEAALMLTLAEARPGHRRLFDERRRAML